MKRIVVTGATGLVGKHLVKALLNREDEVIIFSRDVNKAKNILPEAKEFVEWNIKNPEKWKSKLEKTDAVIHLAGINLFSKRWDHQFKKEILESRQLSTKSLVESIKQSRIKSKVFISASGIGYYGNSGDKILNENSEKGNDFLADVCEEWEKESSQVEQAGVRSVQIRTGLVLSDIDGALKQMVPPFKYFIGGPLGNGKQWSSWLHINDIVGIYLHTLDNENISGAVNAASPNPVRMKEFANTIGRILNRPSLFPVPILVLKLVVGEAADVVTASQKVSVEKLLKSGYKFKYTHLETALRDLLKQKRA